MKKFVVTYKHEEIGVMCKVMTGSELAMLYGFSDCSDVEVLRVWEVGNDGHLIPCTFWGSYTAPFNYLYVYRIGNYEPYEYEWPEH